MSKDKHMKSSERAEVLQTLQQEERNILIDAMCLIQDLSEEQGFWLHDQNQPLFNQKLNKFNQYLNRAETLMERNNQNQHLRWSNYVIGEESPKSILW